MLRAKILYFFVQHLVHVLQLCSLLRSWEYPPPRDRPQVERQRLTLHFLSCRWTAGTGFNLDIERGRAFIISLGRFLIAT